ncbi:MAG: ABC transporter ATP-binding protein [Acidobacteriota bacterium]
MIVVQNVSKTYGRRGGSHRALADVSLEIARGETLGLIGPNGAGKTTLLSCLLGFLRPDGGSILIDGKAPDDLGIRARTGYMPERLGFDRELSGREFLSHHWRLSGGDRSATAHAVAAAAERVGLDTAFLGRKLRTYSRGMLQRIGVAQATFGEPEILFLDEPASGTDPLGVAVVRDRILEAKARGATIVLNSHQLAEVERVCDRVAFLEGGRLARAQSLRGDGAAPRRALLRTDPARGAQAVAALAEQGLPATADGEGLIRLEAVREEDVARAVRILALRDFPVFEARASADLEHFFKSPS